ncbi:glycosyl transferase family 1 [Paenibacillus glycanilyticus]|uniref:Glycosyl transferase family 1 n=1 Tax=Paenibacillus glycanilyticus TaxID=126569 RepID=A0ABQ6NR51_9BACL|nr:glycosyltransferase [Paenibacillus glycanilyticus]GMK46702.1 glycosyl transferase family 1 [Paenibacillus glycanilyticus]
MIKILYIQPYASQVGGVDSVLLQLIEGLDRNRYEPFVLLTAPTAYSERYERLGCRVLYGPVAVFGKPTDAGYYFRNIRTLIQSVAFVRKIVREHGIGLIHSHKMEAFGGNIAGKWMGIPTVQTVHEIPRRPLLAYKLIAWLNHLFNDKVIVLCEPSRRMFRMLGRDSGKVIKIYNGIEPQMDTVAMRAPLTESDDVPLREQLGLSPADKVFLTVARLTPMKGLDDLVDAADRLSKMHPHLKFAIAGDVAFEHEKSYKSSLMTRIRERGLEQTVFLLGLRRDVPWLLDQADALILPSAYDIFPTVVLEAMNAGLPVVATSVGGVPEMVRPETGLLVPPRSGSELAQGIVRLMEMDYQTMGQNARELFLREFTRRRYVDETEQVYSEVLYRHRKLLTASQ